MEIVHPHALWLVITFAVGYTLITFEHIAKINKATIALLTAVICWSIVFITNNGEINQLGPFCEELANISQVVFFLLGALAVVEIINVHNGFKILSDCVLLRSKRSLLWLVTLITFFLSSILDNLTTTVVMLSILRKIIVDENDRWVIGGAVVIAANAGGAWTPIGDVTTTMLWIGGQLTTISMVKELFFPSIICSAVSCTLLMPLLKGKLPPKDPTIVEQKVDPIGWLLFFLGLGLLVFVPIFKLLTGLPPFMGILLALSVLWLVTDICHRSHTDREQLKVPHVLSQIDLSGILFFLGILLAVSALHSSGLLTSLAHWLDSAVGNTTLIALFIGLASAVIDNVPLVAAAMGMYDVSVYPTDSAFWQLIAYCAGTGGSILIVGSAAGIVFMGMEGVNFVWYLRRISLAALIGYLAGAASYIYLR